MRPYYKILNVEETATQDEIKKSYRKLSKKWHPDKHIDPIKKVEAQTKQTSISEAYSILSVKERRLLYDELGINCSMDMIEKQANQLILGIFRQIIKVNFQKEKLFIGVQESFDKAIDKLRQIRGKTDDRMNFLNTVIDTKVNKSRDHLKRAIEEEIQNLESEIIKTDTEIAVHKKALDILENDYTKEEIIQFVNTAFTGTSTTAGTTW